MNTLVEQHKKAKQNLSDAELLFENFCLFHKDVLEQYREMEANITNLEFEVVKIEMELDPPEADDSDLPW